MPWRETMATSFAERSSQRRQERSSDYNQQRLRAPLLR
jgi:hypothetical protein